MKTENRLEQQAKTSARDSIDDQFFNGITGQRPTFCTDRALLNLENVYRIAMFTPRRRPVRAGNHFLAGRRVFTNYRQSNASGDLERLV